MDEMALAMLLEEYRDLLAAMPYSDLTVIPEGNGLDWLSYAEELDAVSRTKHSMGDLIQTSEKQAVRSEEHTSELQSRPQLVCRLLPEKKKHPSRGNSALWAAYNSANARAVTSRCLNASVPAIGSNNRRLTIPNPFSRVGCRRGVCAPP